jgi:hypothetical protein
MFTALLILPVLLLAAVRADTTQDGQEESLFWGTYRPNLYFGLKPRVPQSLMTGLMWFNTMDFQAFMGMQSLRVQLPLIHGHRCAAYMQSGRQAG